MSTRNSNLFQKKLKDNPDVYFQKSLKAIPVLEEMHCSQKPGAGILLLLFPTSIDNPNIIILVIIVRVVVFSLCSKLIIVFERQLLQ